MAKSYTDIEQSKKLAKILPLETADMCYVIDYAESNKYGTDHFKLEVDTYGLKVQTRDNIPCWSLASLLERLPYEVCDDDGNSVYLQINKEEDMYQLEYTDPNGDFESIETDRYEHFVDACVTMIEKLHELKIL